MTSIFEWWSCPHCPFRIKVRHGTTAVSHPCFGRKTRKGKLAVCRKEPAA